MGVKTKIITPEHEGFDSLYAQFNEVSAEIGA